MIKHLAIKLIQGQLHANWGQAEAYNL